MMNTYLATKVSNSFHKYRTRGAVKATSCSLINLKPPETFARPESSNKLAKTDSESDWQEVNYKKKSVKSATKATKPSTMPVKKQSIVNTSITSPPIDAGPALGHSRQGKASSRPTNRTYSSPASLRSANIWLRKDIGQWSL